MRSDDSSQVRSTCEVCLIVLRSLVGHMKGCDCAIVMMENYKQGHPLGIGICSWQDSNRVSSCKCQVVYYKANTMEGDSWVIVEWKMISIIDIAQRSKAQISEVVADPEAGESGFISRYRYQGKKYRWLDPDMSCSIWSSGRLNLSGAAGNCLGRGL